MHFLYINSHLDLIDTEHREASCNYCYRKLFDSIYLDRMLM